MDTIDILEDLSTLPILQKIDDAMTKAVEKKDQLVKD